jgi:serine/threonine protein kinase/tetratricopeptide (TPR) repeat protein
MQSLDGSQGPLDSPSADSYPGGDLPSALIDGFEFGAPSLEPPAADAHAGEAADDGLLGSIWRQGITASEDNESVPRPARRKLPSAGEEVLGLRLVRELGRGAFARVFLAHEIELAARPVAVKISYARRDESNTLAQLQHSHIVPIYSARLDAKSGIRVLVMPYFGGTTLDRLLAKAGPQAEQHPTGRGLLTALDHLSLVGEGHERSMSAFVSKRELSGANRSATYSEIAPRETEIRSLRRRLFGRAITGFYQKATEPQGTTSQPARQILEKSSYIQAVTWIVARLAEGLAHAHQRGIVHRDIKPSNVLIASDGQPMLLDFNLALDMKSPDSRAVAYVGGTLPYMAPEHLDAFNTQNSTPATAVDERSDIYSLGIVLFEMLTSERPFPVENPRGSMPAALERMAAQRRAVVPSARELNHAIPWSLNAIVQRCLSPDPAARYEKASHLAEDLQRELDSLPLRHTKEPSWRERTQKWMRRHPRMSSGGSIATVGLALIAGLIYMILAIGGRLAGYDAERRWIKFQQGLVRAQLLVHTGREPGENLTDGERVCLQTLGLFDITTDPNWIRSSRVRRLEPKVQRRLLDDAVELAILLARTRAEQATRVNGAREQTRLIAEAVDLLNRAESFAPGSIPRALFEDRGNYRLQLGDTVGADQDQTRAATVSVQTARDHYLRGTSLAIEKNYAKAVEELHAALRLDPKHFWARFQLGICFYQLEQFHDAADAYSVCEALWLECAWANFNRGLAYSRLNKLKDAIEDYTAAIRKDRQFADAYLNRGLAYLKLHKYQECVTDLSRAIDLGCHSVSAACSARGAAYAGLGQFDRARADFVAALNDNPNNVSVLLSRAFAFARHDSSLALADFDRVLAEDATCAQAQYGKAYILSDQPRCRDAAICAAREAVRLDGKHLPARCTLAVLLARSAAYGEALEQIQVVLQQSNSGVARYTAACVYSLASSEHPEHAGAALELLESALNSDYGRDVFASDPDLSAIRPTAKFAELVSRFDRP